LMNWCCVSLMVAVPNFMTKSAAAAGYSGAHQASAAATASAVDLGPRHFAGIELIVSPLKSG
jgi:hypothetical protein